VEEIEKYNWNDKNTNKQGIECNSGKLKIIETIADRNKKWIGLQGKATSWKRRVP